MRAAMAHLVQNVVQREKSLPAHAASEIIVARVAPFFGQWSERLRVATSSYATVVGGG
jgi:hypothetical protein